MQCIWVFTATGCSFLPSPPGKSHWETHPEDELLYVLDGEMTVDILEKDGPRSFVVGAGMIAIVPPAAWHRVQSAEGMSVMSATLPGDHIELDVDDPRTSAPDLNISDTMRAPSMIDLDAELAKLTMFRRTPNSTVADRKGITGAVHELVQEAGGLRLKPGIAPRFSHRRREPEAPQDRGDQLTLL